MKHGFLKLTVLCENTAGVMHGLAGEWGLSILIEMDGKKILLDTGQSGSLLTNAAVLGIDLKSVDALVLSHGHYDHTGGLRAFLQYRGNLPVYAHPGLFALHYNTPENPKYIGVPYRIEELASLGAKFAFVTNPTVVTPGMFVSGEVPRKTVCEQADESLFCLENGKMVTDNFNDDMSLYCVTPEGIVIVLGCAHAGLINIVEHAREVTGERRIYGIIGGTHLGPVPAGQQDAAIEFLKELNLQFLAANHCTGLPVISRLASVFGPRFKFCPAGTSFIIPAGEPAAAP